MSHAPTAARPALTYLTVQDMLWLNLQLTKQSRPFPFAKLEEATFLQYGYGASQDLLGQAARFMTGFAKLAPFGEKDKQTALLGTVAFLRANGYRLNVPVSEAASWVERVTSGQIKADEAIQQLALADDHGHEPSVVECLRSALAEYGAQLR